MRYRYVVVFFLFFSASYMVNKDKCNTMWKCKKMGTAIVNIFALFSQPSKIPDLSSIVNRFYKKNSPFTHS